MAMQPHVEFARFRLAPGVSEAYMVGLSDKMEADLASVSGYLARLLMKEADGQFVDVVFWRNASDCAVAVETFSKQSAAAAAYLATMVPVTADRPEADMIMLSPVKTYGRLTLGG